MQGQRTTIYVELLDEGVPCWRPAAAEQVSEGIYRIVDTVPEGEIWQFQPGDVVRCRNREFENGAGLTAYELVAKG